MQEIAIGTGTMKKEQQRSVLRTWRKLIGQPSPQIDVRSTDAKAALATMGLGLKKAKPNDE